MRLLVGQSGRMWLRRFARRTASGCVSWCMVFCFSFLVSSNQVVLVAGWLGAAGLCGLFLRAHALSYVTIWLEI